MGEPSSPGEDGRDAVGARFAAFLVNPVMAGHRAVGGLGFDGLPVGAYEHRGHQPQGPEPCTGGAEVEDGLAAWSHRERRWKKKSPYLGLGSRSGHLRRSSCRPRRSRPRSSEHKRPCRR